MKQRAEEPPGKSGLSQTGLSYKTQYTPQDSHHTVQALRTPTQEQSANGASVQRFATVREAVETLTPNMPVHCYRPHVIEQATRWFLDQFPGEVMYSVKSNPDPRVLHHLHRAGLRHFDVASLPEIQQIAEQFPGAPMYFMHPIKSREAIARAYHEYGIRDFSLDCFEELHKILEVTGGATDLHLHIRLALPKGKAAHDLSGKFGVAPSQAAELLALADKVASKTGLCFHVGSQCMDPSAYTDAIAMANRIVGEAGILLDVLDVGGGFPSVYPGMVPPDLGVYMQTIRDAIAASPNLQGAALWCEPGRALVAESGSAIVRVELRKGDALYLNDGIYGSLFDAGFPGWVFPMRAIRLDGTTSKRMKAYTLYGPTCDSLDTMKGPFLLPEDMKEGDWIEIGQLGAYGATLQTHFNGFFSDIMVEVGDQPQMSLFNRAGMQVAA